MSDQADRLLIIEDNRADSRRLERLLDQVMPHYPREVVTNLHDAGESLQNAEPLMVITDLNLPDSDGLATVDRLLTVAPTVPVVVMTSHGFDSIGLAAVEAGAEDFLTKGTFDALDLARVLLLAIERHRSHVETIRQAHRDGLTGLANRIYFERTLNAALARAGRLSEECAVGFIDVDKFKEINDEFGHLVGDEILCQMADRIRSSLRQYDSGARFGGDEFAVLLTSISSSQALSTVVSRLRDALDQPYRLSDGNVTVDLTASIGVALSGTGPSTLTGEDLINNADRAMYVAKKCTSGFSFYDSSSNPESSKRYDVEHELSIAISGPDLQVHYQPIIAAKSGELAALEALVRWDHPDRGMLDAWEFIESANTGRSVSRIDRAVFKASAEQFGSWLDAFPQLTSVRLELNTSADNWADGAWLEFVHRTCDESGLSLGQICFSVNEASISKFDNAMIERIASIRADGALVSIDHFGSGDVSVRRLSVFPFDVIKIDQTLVADQVSGIQRMLEMVSAIHGVSIVGVGIEHAEHKTSLLASARVDFAQGYVYGVPGDAQATEAGFKDWPGFAAIPTAGS